MSALKADGAIALRAWPLWGGEPSPSEKAPKHTAFWVEASGHPIG
jgi:hypothetical protein